MATRSIHGYVVSGLRDSDVDVVNLKTKVPLSTLRKIRDGHIKNPGIKSIEVLYFYFLDKEGGKLRRQS